MSLFDHVRQWPITEETRLVVRLKYGVPQDTPEYLGSLPDAVVTMAYNKFMDAGGGRPHHPPDANGQRATLGFMISGGREDSLQVITDCLCRYHCLVA